MQWIAQLVQQISPTDAAVLIFGSSGAGKGLVARALHFASWRRDRPMVTVHCTGVEARTSPAADLSRTKLSSKGPLLLENALRLCGIARAVFNPAPGSPT
jgi:hypothetical protein